MLNDFDLIVHKFPSSITIYPIADVHYGAIEHNQQAWEQFIKMIKADPNAYIILDGDLCNNGIRSAKMANPFDEVVRPRQQKERMVEYLEDISDRILCSVGGNHEYRSVKDSDVDLGYDIMARLRIEDLYRPNMAFMKLSLGKRTNANKAMQSYIFGVVHGSSTSKNRPMADVIEGLDCLITGHTHEGQIIKPSKIVIDPQNNMVSLKPYNIIVAESWLDYGGYAMRKMYRPSETCNPQRLHLSMNKKQIEVRW